MSTSNDHIVCDTMKAKAIECDYISTPSLIPSSRYIQAANGILSYLDGAALPITVTVAGATVDLSTGDAASLFSVSAAGAITILQTGVYRISYGIGMLREAGAGEAGEALVYLQNDTTAARGVEHWVAFYVPDLGAQLGSTVHGVYQNRITAGNVLRLYLQHDFAAQMQVNRPSLLIEYISP